MIEQSSITVNFSKPTPDTLASQAMWLWNSSIENLAFEISQRANNFHATFGFGLLKPVDFSDPSRQYDNLALSILGYTCIAPSLSLSNFKDDDILLCRVLFKMKIKKEDEFVSHDGTIIPKLSQVLSATTYYETIDTTSPTQWDSVNHTPYALSGADFNPPLLKAMRQVFCDDKGGSDAFSIADDGFCGTMWVSEPDTDNIDSKTPPDNGVYIDNGNTVVWEYAIPLWCKTGDRMYSEYGDIIFIQPVLKTISPNIDRALSSKARLNSIDRPISGRNIDIGDLFIDNDTAFVNETDVNEAQTLANCDSAGGVYTYADANTPSALRPTVFTVDQFDIMSSMLMKQFSDIGVNSIWLLLLRYNDEMGDIKRGDTVSVENLYTVKLTPVSIGANRFEMAPEDMLQAVHEDIPSDARFKILFSVKNIYSIFHLGLFVRVI